QTAAPAPAAPSADAKPAADRAGGASDRITVKAPVKKATPTPTRRQALAARQERINPVLDKKEQRRRDRAARNQQREDSFLKVHAKPVNTMIRDYVDSRWSLAEFVLPLLLLILLSTMLGGRNPFFMLAGMAISYGAMLLVAIDMVLMWRGCRRALRQHFPNEPLKGKFGYAASRAMSMRRTRLPRAEVKRGNKFTWPRPLS
ncbi:MAG: DUF3043 domain-containing protein, partial [Propionibacteriaceae bacterium]|nr:DUF3043 domain-containing protein [Propionibacteriaceae bacterium]